MNKIFIALTAISAAFFSAAPVSAQTLQAEQRTTLYINVTVEQRELIAGPYARYAQKFLGVAAPLADKVSFEVVSVKVFDTNVLPVYGDDFGITSPTHMNPSSGFPRLTIDKTSAIAMSLEESARAAAATIFAIRKSRLDLITGEVGENVFGGGLKSALAELSRLEEEHLSLFLGRQTARTVVKQYRIAPVKSRLNYTVCRFSRIDGLLSEDDLSAEPMVLELKPIENPEAKEGLDIQAKPSARTVPYLIPADVRCTIILEGREFASEVFNVMQLGEKVNLVK